jgi:hypothetical protein
MIMSQQTGTFCPRHQLPDSAQHCLVLTLLRGIHSIRLGLTRHTPEGALRPDSNLEVRSEA